MSTPPTAPFAVRALASDAERDALFQTSAAMFSSNPHAEAQAREWRAYVEDAPGFDPAMLRGALRGDTYLGGYIHYERTLRLGSALVRAGCIGDVATRPEHRGQGVASALMRDAVAYGAARGQGLLLLDGVAGFYQRFGFVDVLDITRHLVSRAAVLALPESRYAVRPATEDDAPALLALHERHYGGHRGALVRTPAQQRYFVRARLPKNPPLVAVSPNGVIEGCLLLPWHAEQQYAQEATADSWPAALALLRRHALLLGAGAEVPEELIWPAPPGSATFFHLADRLAVTSRCHHHPNEGWMARPADLRALLDAVAPELQLRWAGSEARSRGGLVLAVEGQQLSFAPAESGAAGAADTARAEITPQVLTQLLFGYRPAWWAAQQPGQRVPAAALPALEALFPPGTAWLAGSDAF